MGRMSKAQLGLDLTNVVRFPMARKGEIKAGALPEESILTTALSER